MLVKQEFLAEGKALFPDINITTEGRPYLGSYIGTNSEKKGFVAEMVDEWKDEIEKVAKAAEQEPQLAYSAYVISLSKK